MSNKIFDPNQWQSLPSKETLEPISNKPLTQFDDVVNVISQIESQCIDITANYSDWVNIGFALATEFGETGRSLFHRISRFYLKYEYKDCDKQFDHCLKSQGHGVTIKTFFHLAKQAGINISMSNRPESVSQPLPKPQSQKSPLGESKISEAKLGVFNTPRLPDSIYSHLPGLLTDVCGLFEDPVEKDIILLSSLAVISGCLPKVQGFYFEEPVTPHFYLFITAPAGSGKGKMKWAKNLGQKIHESIVAQTKILKEEYEAELEIYNNSTRKEKKLMSRPEQPPQKMFYIPANSSSSAFIQALADNDFHAVVFETEADTLANTFKQEWGNFSDVLRKAFHHENTSMFRRRDNEYIEIKDPHIAIALSGTPKQVHNMMPDTENGLFSRFLYYAFEDNTEFKNPFISYKPFNYPNFFSKKGDDVFALYQQLKGNKSMVNFAFTAFQAKDFTETFRALLSKNKTLLDRDFEANIKRLGLITFRIAMILSTIRIIDHGDFSSSITCSNTDYNIAIQIVSKLTYHAMVVFQNLPNHQLKGIKLKFYQSLPTSFKRQDYLKVANELKINPKTAEKYISDFKPDFLDHVDQVYTKKKAMQPGINTKTI